MTCAQAAVSCAFLLLGLAPLCNCALGDVIIDAHSAACNNVLLLQAALRIEKVENGSEHAAGADHGASAGGNLTAEALGRRHLEDPPQRHAAYRNVHQLAKHRLEAARARLVEQRFATGTAQAPRGLLQLLRLARGPTEQPSAWLPLWWLGGSPSSESGQPFVAAVGYHLALLVAICVLGCCWREDGLRHQEAAKKEPSAS